MEQEAAAGRRACGTLSRCEREDRDRFEAREPAPRSSCCGSAAHGPGPAMSICLSEAVATFGLCCRERCCNREELQQRGC